MSEDTCPATNNRGEPCGLAAGWGTDNDTGPCKYHGGAGGDVGDVRGAPENNTNAETHGLTSDPGKYYERQSDAEQTRIDSWAESWARRADYGLPGFDKILYTTAISLHQVEQADEYIGNEGVVVAQVVDRTESGVPITKDEENPALALKSRAMKDIVRTLKEFGCLDDPDSKQAAAQADTADALRDYMRQADQ